VERFTEIHGCGVFVHSLEMAQERFVKRLFLQNTLTYGTGRVHICWAKIQAYATLANDRGAAHAKDMAGEEISRRTIIYDANKHG
jgi:hypothetical protein